MWVCGCVHALLSNIYVGRAKSRSSPSLTSSLCRCTSSLREHLHIVNLTYFLQMSVFASRCPQTCIICYHAMHVVGEFVLCLLSGRTLYVSTWLVGLSATSHSIAETYPWMGALGVSKFSLTECCKIHPFTCLFGQTWKCLSELDDLCIENSGHLCLIAVLGIGFTLHSIKNFPHSTSTGA